MPQYPQFVIVSVGPQSSVVLVVTVTVVVVTVTVVEVESSQRKTSQRTVVLVDDDVVVEVLDVVGAVPAQLPAVHATPGAQTLPQAPQLAASFCRSVHTPLHAEHAGVQ